MPKEYIILPQRSKEGKDSSVRAIMLGSNCQDVTFQDAAMWIYSVCSSAIK